MPTNIERYKSDLEKLIKDGEKVRQAFLCDTHGQDFDKALLKQLGGDKKKFDEFKKELPDFKLAYQAWYSESMALIKQLLPDRLNDFVRHYEKPKGRKEIDFENYRIEDALQGLRVTRGGETITDGKAALPHLEQQLSILLAVRKRFESSLFEIRQMVQADLLDSEVDAARELLKNKFFRAAGAVVGVVLEKHLAQVCKNHSIAITKKNPTIADFNEALKAASVIDVAQWRFHQHLADVRNLCDHNKSAEPTQDQVKDLINGVDKVVKTIN